jgi:hypothetical protein
MWIYKYYLPIIIFFGSNLLKFYTNYSVGLAYVSISAYENLAIRSNDSSFIFHFR